MAGLTNSLSFKSLSLSRPISQSQPLSVSSSNSNLLFGLRLFNPNFDNPNSLSLSSSSSRIHTSVSARHRRGRFHRKWRSGGNRSSRDSPKINLDDDEEALDISTIESATVRLKDEQQNMVGVVSKNEALRMAEDAKLDLVILSRDADPPVVRIMDYKKHKYELQKKKREQQHKIAANRMDLKEIKMGYNIDVHDYSLRAKAAKQFLQDGDKVKIIVDLMDRKMILRGEFRDNGIELLKRFQNDVGEFATEESKSFEEKYVSIVLLPKKGAVQKSQEPPTNKEKSAATEVSASVSTLDTQYSG